MSSLCVFLNTAVENSGLLTWIGDTGLTPFRYLFNGKTIRIEHRDSDKAIVIDHVASFHERGSLNYKSMHSVNNFKMLESSSMSWIKTALSVVFLIPGLFLAVFKGLAYLHADVREKHRLVQEHLTTINREIGSVAKPITSRNELYEALSNARLSDRKNRPTDALIIHGDGKLTINEDPGILHFNPMKLILEGARIVHEPNSSMESRLDEAIARTGKWIGSVVVRVNSINEALQTTAPRRSWLSCKRYHMIFNLAIPITG